MQGRPMTGWLRGPGRGPRDARAGRGVDEHGTPATSARCRPRSERSALTSERAGSASAGAGGRSWWDAGVRRGCHRVGTSQGSRNAKAVGLDGVVASAEHGGVAHGGRRVGEGDVVDAAPRGLVAPAAASVGRRPRGVRDVGVGRSSPSSAVMVASPGLGRPLHREPGRAGRPRARDVGGVEAGGSSASSATRPATRGGDDDGGQRPARRGRSLRTPSAHPGLPASSAAARSARVVRGGRRGAARVVAQRADEQDRAIRADARTRNAIPRVPTTGTSSSPLAFGAPSTTPASRLRTRPAAAS